VELDLDGYAASPSPEVEAAAWYIACEAVSNAVKHAQASRIVLELRADNGSLTVRVEDDGRGHARQDGSGLRGIADRAEAVGGTLQVQSGDGGTTVTGVLPCGS
jgi:signal transduction histidine kinase